MRALVCGGRDYGSRERVFAVLDELHRATPITLVIHGAYDGADMLADEWALSRGVARDPYPADWRRYGGAAGPIRNARMLRQGKPDLVVAFPGHNGTADMLRRARKAGVRIVEVAA